MGHVGEQEEGAAGADPAAAGGEDTARVHPRGSQVGLQQSLLGECPRCETNHNNGASSACESRTRGPPEHSAPPHPCRGNGGAATAAAHPKPKRPSSLLVGNGSNSLSSLNIPIETPTNVMNQLDFNALMDGRTGLTPTNILTPIMVNM